MTGRCIVELKIWRGVSYDERGGEQLTGYLIYNHPGQGYMASFCFNSNKQPWLRGVKLGERAKCKAVVQKIS